MNFSLGFARKAAFVAVSALVIAGCGPRDGLKEFNEGQAAFADRNLKKADKLFEKCLKCVPDNVDYLVHFARTKLELGELAAADEAMTRAWALASEDLDVRLLSAQLAWHLEDYRRAGKIFRGVAEDTALEPSARAQGWTGLGIVEMTENNQQLARVAFLRAIRLDRRNAAAWYHLALLYRDGLNYLDAAIEQFEIYVRLDTLASPRVQKVQRTVIPALKEQRATLLAQFPGASRRNSSASATALSQAQAAWSKKQFKTALRNYQEALKADPLSVPAALGLAQAYLKTDASRVGMQRAFENYQLACKLSPGKLSAFLTTGALATKLGYHGQAVEIYSRAVAAAPTSIDALDGFIGALKRVGGKNSIAQAYQNYRDSLKLRK